MSAQDMNSSLLEREDMIARAKYHNQASRVRDLKSEKPIINDEKCECCNMSPSYPQFPLDCDIFKLGQLGVGYSLFFYTARALFIILAFGSIFSGFPCMLSNYLQSGGSLHDKPSNWSSESSVQKGKNPVWQGVLMFIYSLFIVAGIFYYRKFIIEKIAKIDEHNITPSDFTVVVKGVSKNIDLTEFIEYFKQYALGDSDNVQVVAVSPSYNILEYVKLEKELKKINKHQNFIQRIENKSGKVPKRDKLCRKIPTKQELNLKVEEIKDLQNKFVDPDHLKNIRGDWVFITLKKQSDCKKIIKKWFLSDIDVIIKFFTKCSKKYSWGTGTYNGLHIMIEQAPEPSDIIWENLTVSAWTKFKKRTKTFFTTLVLLVMSFYILLSIKIYQYNTYEDSGRISNKDNIKIKAISLLLSVTIILLNVVITKSIRYFSKYEKPSTWTQYNVSVFHKLVIATTINTVAMLLLVNSYNVQQGYAGKDGINLHWFSKSYGLPSDICNLLLVDAFFTPFLQIFDPSFLWLLFKRHLVVIGIKKVNQAQANKLWTNPEMDLAQRSARYITVFLVSLLFAPLFPMGLFIGAISIFIKYFVDKELLLRRCSRSKDYGSGVTMAVLIWLPICLVGFSISNLIVQMVSHDLEGKYLIAPSMGIAIIVIFALIPYSRIMNSFLFDSSMNNVEINEEDDDFDSKVMDLNDDYLRSNPVTSKKAWIEWLENIKNIRSKEEMEKEFKRNSNQILMAGLEHYMLNRPSGKIMENLRKSGVRSSFRTDGEDLMRNDRSHIKFIDLLNNKQPAGIKNPDYSLNSDTQDPQEKSFSSPIPK